MGELARHATTSAAKGAGDLAGRVAAGAVVAAIVTVATGCPVTGFKAGAGTAGV